MGRTLVPAHHPQRLSEVVPPDITYAMPEARAAFFPVYPIARTRLDMVLPGGDTFAGDHWSTS